MRSEIWESEEGHKVELKVLVFPFFSSWFMHPTNPTPHSDSQILHDQLDRQREKTANLQIELQKTTEAHGLELESERSAQLA